MRAIVGGCRRTYASLVAACIAMLMLAVAAPAQAQAEGCAFADAQASEAAPADLAAATICLLNERRAAAGLAPLRASEPLTATADHYARYMVSEEHFAHRDESGHNVVSRVLEADPALADRWLVVGENLGWGTYGLATPRSMVEGWMNSPTHRDNILYPRYDEIGVGIVAGAPVPDRSEALTYTTVFGKLAPPEEQQQPQTRRRADDARRVPPCEEGPHARRARPREAPVRREASRRPPQPPRLAAQESPGGNSAGPAPGQISATGRGRPTV